MYRQKKPFQLTWSRAKSENAFVEFLSDRCNDRCLFRGHLGITTWVFDRNYMLKQKQSDVLYSLYFSAPSVTKSISHGTYFCMELWIFFYFFRISSLFASNHRPSGSLLHQSMCARRSRSKRMLANQWQSICSHITRWHSWTWHGRGNHQQVKCLVQANVPVHNLPSIPSWSFRIRKSSDDCLATEGGRVRIKSDWTPEVRIFLMSVNI